MQPQLQAWRTGKIADVPSTRNQHTQKKLSETSWKADHLYQGLGIQEKSRTGTCNLEEKNSETCDFNAETEQLWTRLEQLEKPKDRCLITHSSPFPISHGLNASINPLHYHILLTQEQSTIGSTPLNCLTLILHVLAIGRLLLLMVN